MVIPTYAMGSVSVSRFTGSSEFQDGRLGPHDLDGDRLSIVLNLTTNLLTCFVNQFLLISSLIVNDPTCTHY